MIQEEKTLTLNIEKVAYGGKGIATHEGKKIFIADAIIGDKVEVAITKEQKSFCEAKLLRILEKSPDRIKSPCSYSETCGGCGWIDVNQNKQNEFKENFIGESFARIAKEPIKVPVQYKDSPKSFYYRNRILLRGTYDKGLVTVGFFGRESHTQIAINHCKIAHPSINELITYLNKQILKKKRKQKFRLEIQALPSPKARNEKDQGLLITLHPIERNHELQDLYEVLKKILFMQTSMLPMGAEKIFFGSF